MPITFNPNVSFKQQQPAAQVPLNPVTESIYTPIEQEKPAKKPSKFINGISNIAKFFASVGEIAKGVGKGLLYGTTTAVATLGGFFLLGGLPKAAKNGKEAIKEAFKHPLKNVSRTGKVVAAILSTGVAATHVIKGILNKNQRNSDIEHKLQTGHTV